LVGVDAVLDAKVGSLFFLLQLASVSFCASSCLFSFAPNSTGIALSLMSAFSSRVLRSLGDFNHSTYFHFLI
jgi:hypothetical protein